MIAIFGGNSTKVSEKAEKLEELEAEKLKGVAEAEEGDCSIDKTEEVREEEADDWGDGCCELGSGTNNFTHEYTYKYA